MIQGIRLMLPIFNESVKSYLRTSIVSKNYWLREHQGLESLGEDLFEKVLDMMSPLLRCGFVLLFLLDEINNVLRTYNN